MDTSTSVPDVVLGPNETGSRGMVAANYKEIRIEIVRTLEGIEDLRSTWQQWTSHPNSDLDSYLTVLRSLPETQPFTLVLYRGTSPEAILVGRTETGPVSLRIGYKDLAKVSAKKLVFIYRGLLGASTPDSCAALVQGVKTALLQQHGQIAFFNSVPENSPLINALFSQSFFTRDHSPSLQTHRCMALPAGKEEFYHRLNPKVRKNLGWQARKFEKDLKGSLHVRCFRRAEELADMLQQVETIAKKTYQRGLGVGFENNSTIRERLSLEARKGWLRAFVLYAGDIPVAFWLGKVYRETFHSDFMGYDPDLAKYSPGMYLITRVIETFCDSRDEDAVLNIDFGLGDAQYKEVLGTSEWQEVSLHLFAPTATGLSLNLLRTPAALANRLVKGALNKRSALKVKRAWRNQAKPGAAKMTGSN